MQLIKFQTLQIPHML